MEDKIGAFWQRSGAKGEYLSGQIELNGEKINVIAFKNGRKSKSNHPDWILYLQRPRQDVAPPPEREAGGDSVPF